MESSPDAYISESKPDLKTTLTKPRAVSYFSPLQGLLTSFSPAERLALYALTAVLALATLGLLAGVNAKVSTLVPSEGGALT